MLGIGLWFGSGTLILVLAAVSLNWARGSSRPEKLAAKWRNLRHPLGRVRR